MSNTNYSEWIKTIEEEYDKNNLRNQRGDLKIWFLEILGYNTKIQDELAYHNTMKYKEVSFLVSTIAWAFQEENYKKTTHKAIVEKNGKKTVFGQPENLFRCIKNNWDKLCTPPYDTFNGITLGIPRIEEGNLDKYKNQLVKKSKKEKDDENTATTWIWVCSALQKRYKIFKNIEELNKFIFTVSDMNGCSELQNYGLYVRDISELCLAYAILHGYSLDEELDLLKSANTILQADQCGISTAEMNAENTYTQIVKDSFGKFLSAPFSDSKESFLTAIKANVKVFIRKNTDEETVQPNHWSSLKTLLRVRNSVLQDKMRIERNFESRLQSIARLYDKLIGEDVILRHRPRTSLSKFLSKCIAVYDMQSLLEWCGTREALQNGGRGDDVIQEANQEINTIISDIIKSHLRYICIFSIMKEIQGDTGSAEIALDLINDELRSAGCREIEDFEVDAAHTVTAKDNPNDWFDWFVVKAVIFEEVQGDLEEDQENACVSGYETFMDYVFQRKVD